MNVRYEERKEEIYIYVVVVCFFFWKITTHTCEKMNDNIMYVYIWETKKCMVERRIERMERKEGRKYLIKCKLSTIDCPASIHCNVCVLSVCGFDGSSRSKLMLRFIKINWFFSMKKKIYYHTGIYSFGLIHCVVR